jgi:hypothetical protein
MLHQKSLSEKPPSNKHRMHPRIDYGVIRLVFRMRRTFPRRVAIHLALFLVALSSAIAAAQPLRHAAAAEKLKAAFTNLKAIPNSRTPLSEGVPALL